VRQTVASLLHMRGTQRHTFETTAGVQAGSASCVQAKHRVRVRIIIVDLTNQWPWCILRRTDDAELLLYVIAWIRFVAGLASRCTSCGSLNTWSQPCAEGRLPTSKAVHCDCRRSTECDYTGNYVQVEPSRLYGLRDCKSSRSFCVAEVGRATRKSK
jgi:hypothetical protein